HSLEKLRAYSAVALGQSDLSVKYFLSENDILSNHSVPKIEVRNKAHWEGRFNDQGRLVILDYYSRENHRIRRKEYTYDKQGNLTVQEEKGPDGNLVSRMSMGLDEDALRFVKYLYGVNQVMAWGDRFTIRRYSKDRHPFETTFYEADGQPYGRIEEVRDPEGRLRYQVWTRLPDREVIRRWEYTYFPRGGYSLKQYNRAGELVEFKTYNREGRRIVIQLSAPDTSRRTNRIEVAYRLSDTLRTARVYLQDQTGINPKAYSLTETDLLPGYHRLVLEDNPELDDRGRFMIRMEGETLREGPCQPDTVRGIRFDTNPPVVRLKIDSVISVPVIQFTTSESLIEATVVWLPDSATVLLPTPPVIKIEAPRSQTTANNPFLRYSVSEKVTELTAWIYTPEGRFQYHPDVPSGGGEQVWRIPESLIESVEEINRIALVGSDAAGNVSDTALVRKIRFDFVKPVLTMIYPQSNSIISDGGISIVASEAMAEFRAEWKPVGDDSGAFGISITDAQSRSGEKTLLTPPVENRLIPGKYYDLAVMGLDSAGNPSNWVTIDSLEYDPVPPELLISQPEYGAELDTLKIAYEVSEILSAGWLYLQKLEPAETDTMIFRLPDSLLSAGAHLYYPLFQAGPEQFGDYKLWLVGEDRAGNMSEPA
ncbi:MAG: hypothetical protein ACE5D1_08295, partial [Fidelibacterota bacterium]